MLQILWMCRNTLSGRIPITTYNLSWLKLDLIGDNFCPIVTINETIANTNEGEKFGFLQGGTMLKSQSG